jgi:hypothetical protein
VKRKRRWLEVHADMLVVGASLARPIRASCYPCFLTPPYGNRERQNAMTSFVWG